jgi:hypothetical protein
LILAARRQEEERHESSYGHPGKYSALGCALSNPLPETRKTALDVPYEPTTYGIAREM